MYSLKTAPKKVLLSSLHILMRKLSNDDDEGSENVAKKMNLRSFKLLSRIFGFAQFVKWGRCLLELNSQGIYPGSQREREIPRVMFTSCIKRHIAEFHVVVVQWTSKEYTKSTMHLPNCCFAHKNNHLLTLSSSSWSC